MLCTLGESRGYISLLAVKVSLSLAPSVHEALYFRARHTLSTGRFFQAQTMLWGCSSPQSPRWRRRWLVPFIFSFICELLHVRGRGGIGTVEIAISAPRNFLIFAGVQSCERSTSKSWEGFMRL